MPLARAYVALGSNKGDRLKQMRSALELLESGSAVKVLRLSPVFQNRAIGMGDADDFFNAVAAVETSLDSLALLDACLGVEKQLGRERSDAGWIPRTIDLDLLLYDDEQLESERLTLPHPRIAERDFVAVPLLNLDPDLSVSGIPIREIVDSLESIELEKIEENLR